jgi:hypothetical protein
VVWQPWVKRLCFVGSFFDAQVDGDMNFPRQQQRRSPEPKGLKQFRWVLTMVYARIFSTDLNDLRLLSIFNAAGELSSTARNFSCGAADLDGCEWGLCTRQR